MSNCPLCGTPMVRSGNNFGLACPNPDCAVRGPLVDAANAAPVSPPPPEEPEVTVPEPPAEPPEVAIDEEQPPAVE